MSSARPYRYVYLGLFSWLFVSAAAAQPQQPAAEDEIARKHPGSGPYVIPPSPGQATPLVDGEPADGPLDPGPWVTQPGYFTRRAVELNYNRTPFFNGRGAWGYRGSDPFDGSWGYGQSYFPGVYPYYDAQAHYRWYKAYKRERKLVTSAREMREDGRERFAAGDYETAAVRFLGAAELDHGDAAARIHAGHALFALGRYADAAGLLRRGLELQPTLAYAAFDPRLDYGNPTDFGQHMSRLRDRVTQHPGDAGAQIVLAYMVYYTEGPTKARPLLALARAISPRDSLVERLWRVADVASYSDESLRTGRPDMRPYDRMNIRPQPLEPYDRESRPASKSGKRAKSAAAEEARRRA